jgi:hypothetical protein
VLSGGGVHEPGCREPDASLRSALQAALPRAQRRAEGPFLFRSCFFTLPGLVVFQCQFCTFRVRSRPGAHAFSGFWQAETDTDEVYAQIMLMPEPEVASSQLGTTLFSRRVSGKLSLGAMRVLTCCRACLFRPCSKTMWRPRRRALGLLRHRGQRSGHSARRSPPPTPAHTAASLSCAATLTSASLPWCVRARSPSTSGFCFTRVLLLNVCLFG